MRTPWVSMKFFHDFPQFIWCETAFLISHRELYEANSPCWIAEFVISFCEAPEVVVSKGKRHKMELMLSFYSKGRRHCMWAGARRLCSSGHWRVTSDELSDPAIKVLLQSLVKVKHSAWLACISAANAGSWEKIKTKCNQKSELMERARQSTLYIST